MASGRKGDPLWSVRHDLLRAREHLTDRAWGRLGAAFQADWWDELECAWTLCSETSTPGRPPDWHTWAGAFDVAETNRLAKTLRSWEPELLAYFDTGLTNGVHRRHQPDHQSRQTRLRLRTPTTTASRPLPLRLTHSTRDNRTPPAPSNA